MDRGPRAIIGDLQFGDGGGLREVKEFREGGADDRRVVIG
jgi:ActR/RegA family two-component response regulator